MITTAAVRDTVLSGYQLTIKDFDKSFQLHTADPELAQKIFALEKHITESKVYMSPANDMPLGKQEAWDHMKKVEQSKIQAMAQLEVAFKQKKLHPEQVQMMIEITKIRLFDKLFLEEGIEEEDLHLAMIKYNFRERQIFTDMMDQSAKDIQFAVDEIEGNATGSVVPEDD